VAAPTPPETPVSPGDGGGPPSPQFVYVSAAVSAAPLTPPASEYSSDPENAPPADAAGPAVPAVGTVTAADAATVYGLIDYVIEQSAADGSFDQPPVAKHPNGNRRTNAGKPAAAEHYGTATAGTPTAQVAAACNSGNRGEWSTGSSALPRVEWSTVCPIAGRIGNEQK